MPLFALALLALLAVAPSTRADGDSPAPTDVHDARGSMAAPGGDETPRPEPVEGRARLTVDPAYLPELVARARALRLADDPAFLRLGHWRRRPFGGWKSEADGPAFFRAPAGKTDPAAELEATLAGFFDAAPKADEQDDAMCRFPARLAFLSARLGIDPVRLPRRPCPRQEEFLARVAPVGVTLVFSSYYLNNPASAFGHTFLRLDKAGDGARPGERAELLDYGVDYSASLDGSTGLAYAVKGLFGGFRGNFSHLAYYYKVREYADAESRDLWEYDLALSADEVALLAAHLWELGGTWFDYWYLDENCSYHVLGALEAAAPRLALLDRLGWVVLPSETVKALFANPGLVRAAHYRPSILTQFRARLEPLSPAARDAVEALSGDPAAPLPDALGAERAAALDAALDHLDLVAGKDLVLGKDPAAARRRQVLLERRAALGVAAEPLVVPPPEARAPERGHGSLRAGVGGGASRADGPLVLLDVRLALHDLADPPEGYPEVAQIEFLPTRLRIAPRNGRVELDESWLMRSVSLNGVERFDRRPSWHFRFGAETLRDAGCDRCLVAAASVGAGFTALRLLGAADLLGTLDLDLHAAPGLAGLAGTGFRPGLGPTAILRLGGGVRGAILAEARWRWLPDAVPRETWRLAIQGRLHLGRTLSLALEAARAPRDERVSAIVYAFR